MRAAGAILVLDAQGPLLRGQVDPSAIAVLREHRDRVAAILRLRDIHLSMGFAEEDVALIERALLSGAVNEIRVAVRPPAGVTA